MNYLEPDFLNSIVNSNSVHIQCKKGHFITSFWKCVFDFVFRKFLFCNLSFACMCVFWFCLAFCTITVSQIFGSTVLVQKDV